MDQHSDGGAFEQLYLKERKKSNIFMATTAVAVIIALGALVYAGNKKPEGAVAGTGTNGPIMQMGPGEAGGGVRMGPGMDMTDYLNEDGTVDTAQVEEMLNRLPAEYKDGFLERMGTRIDDAKDSGDITEAQADELKNAFGITGETSES